MFEIYRKLGLLKTILDERSQYSDIPEGYLDVDRMMASQPAFRSVSDSQNYKKKKLVLNVISFFGQENTIWKLRFLMVIHQLIDDGFEVYQYRDSKPYLLTTLSVSTLLEHLPYSAQLKKDEIMIHRLMDDLNISYDDVAVVNEATYSQLEIKRRDEPCLLWQSDYRSLNIINFSIIKDQFKLSYLVNNIKDSQDDQFKSS